MHGGVQHLKAEMKKRNPEAVLAVFPPPRGPEGKAGLWSMDGFFTAVSVNATIPENRQRNALKLLDYLFSPEGMHLLRYGVENVHWKKTSETVEPLFSGAREGVVLERIDRTAGLRMFLELGDVWVPEWQADRDLIVSVNETTKRLGSYDRFMYRKTPAQKQYERALYDLTLRRYIDMVKTNSVEKNWESYRAEFLERGGRKIIEERNSGL